MRGDDTKVVIGMVLWIACVIALGLFMSGCAGDRLRKTDHVWCAELSRDFCK